MGRALPNKILVAEGDKAGVEGVNYTFKGLAKI